MGAVSVLDTRVHLWEDVIQGIDYVVCARILRLVMRILQACCMFGALMMPASVLPASQASAAPDGIRATLPELCAATGSSRASYKSRTIREQVF